MTSISTNKYKTAKRNFNLEDFAKSNAPAQLKNHDDAKYEFDIDTLTDALTIDVQTHGKWLINCDGYYPYCSVCTEEPESRNMTKYCPNCGAKMDLK